MARFNKLIFENFMSLGYVELEFDESNIITIAGFNDSGKSAITRGIEVLFYNAYSTEQAKFIKDDTDFFRITIIDDDGIKVIREKHLDGHSVWELRNDRDEVLYTNLTGNESGKTVYSVSDVPDKIASYLGVIQDEHTGEKLNVRRNTDKLFLITTTGGDNYKILNAVLRSDVLAEASKRINEDRNKLQNNLTGLSTQVQTLKGEIDHIDVAPAKLIEDLDAKIINLASVRDKAKYLEYITEQKEELDNICIYDELPIIDTARYQDISYIMGLKESLEDVIQPELPTLDTERYRELAEIVRLSQELDTFIVPETTPINTERYSDLGELVRLYNECYNSTVALANIEKELNEVTTQLNALAQTYNIKICSNCGSAVV